MQLAVITTVINLLVLAWVPGHGPIQRYGKEMKRKQNSQPEAGDSLGGKQGAQVRVKAQRGRAGQEGSAQGRMLVVSDLNSSTRTALSPFLIH